MTPEHLSVEVSLLVTDLLGVVTTANGKLASLEMMLASSKVNTLQNSCKEPAEQYQQLVLRLSSSSIMIHLLVSLSTHIQSISFIIGNAG